MSNKKEINKFALLSSWINTILGIIISYLVWCFFLNPLYNLKLDYIDNFEIVLIMTAISIIRGYLCNLYFMKKLIDKLVDKIGE